MRGLLFLLALLLFTLDATARENHGACCVGGTCISAESNEADCVTVYEGRYAGDASTCTQCNANVSCCVDSACATVPFAECTGAVVLACSGNVCIREFTPAPTPIPLGACCHPNGCMYTTEAGCAQLSAESKFLGSSVSCSDSLCVGGCCNADNAGCVDGVKRAECGARGFAGYGVTCARAPTSLCGGACCANDGSTCLHVKSIAHCADDLHGVYAGDGVLCAHAPCRGACCAASGCHDSALRSDCDAEDGQFIGVGVACAKGTCRGACCIDSACVVAAGATECEQLGGGFKGTGVQCDAVGSAYGPRSMCYVPTAEPTRIPTAEPTVQPTRVPSAKPTLYPTRVPSVKPTVQPTHVPTVKPTVQPTHVPTVKPTVQPTRVPTVKPTVQPTRVPTVKPTVQPTRVPTVKPTVQPTRVPTVRPTLFPSANPTKKVTSKPTVQPTTLARNVKADVMLSQLEILSQQCACNASTLFGACCHPESACVVRNPIDCAAHGGFYRGVNSTCSDADICLQCLPCLLNRDETGFCPLRLYHSFASDAHRYHDDSSSSSESSSHKHAHDIHHRNDACEEPQICATNYGRCLVPAEHRASHSNPLGVQDCGGAATLDLECAVELGDGRCGIGVCAPSVVEASYGLMVCSGVREFPCGCQCYDDEAMTCGAAKGVVFYDSNHDGVQQSPTEPSIVGAQVGIWLEDSTFTLPVSTPPVAVRISDERGIYVFNSLRAARYAVVILSLPPPYIVIPTTPSVHMIDVSCPGFKVDTTDDSSSSSSDDEESSSSSSSSSSDSGSVNVVVYSEDSDDSDSDSDSDRHHHPHPLWKRSLETAVARRLVRAGGELSSVQRSEHLSLDNNFGVGASFSVNGRVVRDSNNDRIAQLSEIGVGRAKILARAHPTMHVVATAESSVGDGSFSFPMLPEGVYDFERRPLKGYMATGDSSGNNDNVVPNVVVSYALGDIVSCSEPLPVNTTRVCVDFFVVRIASKRSSSDDDDGDDDRDAKHCHNAATWWLHSDCLTHVWENHITTALATVLFFMLICIGAALCICIVVFSGTKVKREKPAAKKAPTPEPAKTTEKTQPIAEDQSETQSELGNRTASSDIRPPTTTRTDIYDKVPLSPPPTTTTLAAFKGSYFSDL
jgi:hypothetical protein